MPVIDFLRNVVPVTGQIDIGKTVDISIKLLALMKFPDDSTTRDRYYDVQIELFNQKIARKILGEPIAKVTGDEKQDLHISRMSDAYRDTPFPHEKERSQKGLIIGLRLHYVSVLANTSGRGSFNAADFLISLDKWIDSDDQDIPSSRYAIHYAWKLMKPVAHLWAAHRLYPEIYGHGEPTQDAEHFISLAEWYRNFATKYTPPNASATVLNSDLMWLPPDDFNFAEHTLIPFNAYTELSDAKLEKLEEEYRLNRMIRK